MILAIPYNSALPGGYSRLGRSLLRNGKHPDHTLAVLTSEKHDEEAFNFAMTVHGQFGNYVGRLIPDKQESMLKTSNRMFLAAMDLLRTYVSGDHEVTDPPLFYFDPTWRPFKPRWLDEFNTDYYLAGLPTTYGCFKDGKVVGPVVFKKDFLEKSKLLDFLEDSGVHWREFLAWEITNNGVNAEAFGDVRPAYIRSYDSRIRQEQNSDYIKHLLKKFGKEDKLKP